MARWRLGLSRMVTAMADDCPTCRIQRQPVVQTSKRCSIAGCPYRPTTDAWARVPASVEENAPLVTRELFLCEEHAWLVKRGWPFPPAFSLAEA